MSEISPDEASLNNSLNITPPSPQLSPKPHTSVDPQNNLTQTTPITFTRYKQEATTISSSHRPYHNLHHIVSPRLRSSSFTILATSPTKHIQDNIATVTPTTHVIQQSDDVIHSALAINDDIEPSTQSPHPSLFLNISPATPSPISQQPPHPRTHAHPLANTSNGYLPNQSPAITSFTSYTGKIPSLTLLPMPITTSSSASSSTIRQPTAQLQPNQQIIYFEPIVGPSAANNLVPSNTLSSTTAIPGNLLTQHAHIIKTTVSDSNTPLNPTMVSAPATTNTQPQLPLNPTSTTPQFVRLVSSLSVSRPTSASSSLALSSTNRATHPEVTSGFPPQLSNQKISHFDQQQQLRTTVEPTTNFLQTPITRPEADPQRYVRHHASQPHIFMDNSVPPPHTLHTQQYTKQQLPSHYTTFQTPNQNRQYPKPQPQRAMYLPQPHIPQQAQQHKPHIHHNPQLLNTTSPPLHHPHHQPRRASAASLTGTLPQQQHLYHISQHPHHHHTQQPIQPSRDPQLQTPPKLQPPLAPPAPPSHSTIQLPTLPPLPQTTPFDYLPYASLSSLIPSSITATPEAHELHHGLVTSTAQEKFDPHRHGTTSQHNFTPNAIDPVQYPTYIHTQMLNLIYTPWRLEKFLHLAMLYLFRDFLIHLLYVPIQIITFVWQFIVSCCVIFFQLDLEEANDREANDREAILDQNYLNTVNNQNPPQSLHHENDMNDDIMRIIDTTDNVGQNKSHRDHIVADSTRINSYNDELMTYNPSITTTTAPNPADHNQTPIKTNPTDNSSPFFPITKRPLHAQTPAPCHHQYHTPYPSDELASISASGFHLNSQNSRLLQTTVKQRHVPSKPLDQDIRQKSSPLEPYYDDEHNNDDVILSRSPSGGGKMTLSPEVEEFNERYSDAENGEGSESVIANDTNQMKIDLQNPQITTTETHPVLNNNQHVSATIKNLTNINQNHNFPKNHPPTQSTKPINRPITAPQSRDHTHNWPKFSINMLHKTNYNTSLPFYTLLTFVPHLLVLYCITFFTSTSGLYHYIKALSSMKLLAILSMANILDKLLTTFGNDATDWYYTTIDSLKVYNTALHYANLYIKKCQQFIVQIRAQDTRAPLQSEFAIPTHHEVAQEYIKNHYNHNFIQFINLYPTKSQQHAALVPPIVLYTVYLFLHSFFMLIQVTALHIALNSTDGTMYVLIQTSNFAELKTFVFKKYFFITLFQITVSDVAERVQLILHVILVCITSLGYITSMVLSNNNNISALNDLTMVEKNGGILVSIFKFLFGDDLFSQITTQSTNEMSTGGIVTTISDLLTNTTASLLSPITTHIPPNVVESAVNTTFGSFTTSFYHNIPNPSFSSTMSATTTQLIQSFAIIYHQFKVWWFSAIQMIILLYITKMMLDWCKHIFITKFNRLPSYYTLYRHTVARDVMLSTYQPSHPFYQSSQRRYGIIYMPIVLLFYRAMYLFFCNPQDNLDSQTLLQTRNNGGVAAGIFPSIVDGSLFESTTGAIGTSPRFVSPMNLLTSHLSPMTKVMIAFSIFVLCYAILYCLHLFLIATLSKSLLEWNNGYYNTYHHVIAKKDDNQSDDNCGVSKTQHTHPILALFGDKFHLTPPPSSSSSSLRDEFASSSKNPDFLPTHHYKVNDEAMLYELSLLNGSKGTTEPITAIIAMTNAPHSFTQLIPPNIKGKGDKDETLFVDTTLRFGMYANKIPL